MTHRSRESGVALISVLLVFAIAAIIAGEVMFRSYLDIRKTTNFINSKQAYYFALSGEQYARQILRRDFEEEKKRGIYADRLADIWALNFPDFNIEGGEMSIEIHDLQGRFNLNNLVNNSGQVDSAAVADLRRLQQILGLEADYTDRIVDWIDSNKNVFGNGAEDADYNQGYLPANAAMADKTELRLIQGMAIEDYEKLAPLVVALPKVVGEQPVNGTKYNINTVDAKLLEAISSLSAGAAQQVSNRQQKGGYDSLQDWLNSPDGANLGAVSNKIVVKSEFFEIVVTANYQQRITVLTAYLYRDPVDGSITVIKHQLGTG